LKDVLRDVFNYILVLGNAAIKGLAGIAIIALVIVLALVLPKLRLPFIVLIVVACLVPGILRLVKINQINTGKYPAIMAKIISEDDKCLDDRAVPYRLLGIEYTVNEKVYKSVKKWYDGGNLPVETVKVHYNPKKPNEVYLEDYPSSILTNFSIVFGLVAAAIVIIAYYFGSKTL